MAGIKGELHRGCRQGGKVRLDGTRIHAEEAPAARRDNVGPEAEQVVGQHHCFSDYKRREDDEKQVLFLYQG